MDFGQHQTWMNMWPEWLANGPKVKRHLSSTKNKQHCTIALWFFELFLYSQHLQESIFSNNLTTNNYNYKIIISLFVRTQNLVVFKCNLQQFSKSISSTSPLQWVHRNGSAGWGWSMGAHIPRSLRILDQTSSLGWGGWNWRVGGVLLQMNFNSWFVGSGQISSRPKTRVFTRRGSVEGPEIPQNFREIWEGWWNMISFGQIVGLGCWWFGYLESPYEMDWMIGILRATDSNPKPKNPNQQLATWLRIWLFARLKWLSFLMFFLNMCIFSICFWLDFRDEKSFQYVYWNCLTKYLKKLGTLDFFGQLMW